MVRMVTGDVTLSGEIPLCKEAPRTVLKSCTNTSASIDAIPPSLISAFAQSNAISPDERPVKRRRVAGNGPYSLAQERGLSPAGVPVGYIPLSRLELHIVSIKRHLEGKAFI